MKFKGACALLLGSALVGIGFVSVTPAHAAPPQTMSREVALKLQAAQNDIFKTPNYTAAVGLLDQVAAMPASKRTPYADHVLNQLYVGVYEKTNNYAKLAPAIEALMNDSFATPQQTAQLTPALAQIYYQLKNYPKAIQFGTVALQRGYPARGLRVLVGQAYYLNKDWRGTIEYERDLVAREVKAGQKPTKQSLQLVQSSCQQLHDDPCLLDAVQQLILYYPTQQYWQYLLAQVFNTVKSDSNLLQTYRLAFEIGVLKRPHDFTTYAELAIEASDPGEAEQVMTAALKNNMFADPHEKAKAERILADAKRKAAKDLAGGLGSTAEAAALQKTGDSDVRVGLAYFGYQQYDKAVNEIQQGIAKGGLAKPAEAHLLLGVAQLKAGHKNAALRSFGRVKGDPTLARLAALWSLKARSA